MLEKIVSWFPQKYQTVKTVFKMNNEKKCLLNIILAYTVLEWFQKVFFCMYRIFYQINAVLESKKDFWTIWELQIDDRFQIFGRTSILIKFTTIDKKFEASWAEQILPEPPYKAISSPRTDVQTLTCLQGWMTQASRELWSGLYNLPSPFWWPAERRTLILHSVCH